MAGVAEEIAALRGTRRSSLKDLFTHGSFSRLWRAMLVSSLGDWVGFVAVAALVARLGGQRLGGLAVSGVMLARLLPSVLFGPIAGAVTDRFDRRKVMVGADIGRGVLYASMPFMPGLAAILFVSFLIECMSLLWTPAKDASVPNLVPRSQLSNANSIGLVTTYGTLPLGGAIFTALTGVSASIGTGIPYFNLHPEFLALWLNALTFLFSARMVWGLGLRQEPLARPGSPSVPKFSWNLLIQDVRDGYRFLREHPVVRAMTVGIVVAFAGVGAVISLGPIFARYSLNAGSAGFGFLVIAFGIGMGIGMGSMNFFVRFLDKDSLFYTAMFSAAGSLFLTAAMPGIGWAAFFAIPMGIGVGLTWVTGYTMLQENVTDEFRGRTFATLTIAARMTLFLALVVFPAFAALVGDHTVSFAGEILDFSGARITLYVGGLTVIMAGLVSMRGMKKSRLTRLRPLSLIPRFRKMERSGIFIVFEGVEGAGKGTQIELARDYLRSKGREVVMTREPGGTGFGDRLREAILDAATGKVDPRAEALLFAASRAHLVTSVIRPALAEGKVVLCDRFIDSSIAYQGVARGLGEQDVLTLNAWATQGLFPDVVILLHLDPEESLARAPNRNDRFEAENLAFHQKVSDAYLKIAEEHPERFQVIDAGGTPEEVHRRVREALDKIFDPTEP
ncbi:MAG TPA: dTMP kinase [Actinomycetota bacterium]|nr:dTMP kinase [Actinomycetota bacterium]